MEKINVLVEEIKSLTESFMIEATNNLNGNKAAGRRARKATLELTKLYKEYSLYICSDLKLLLI